MYIPTAGVVAVLGLAAQTTASPHPRSSSRLAPSSRALKYASNRDRANAVKQTFEISWDGYYKYAFPHDSLLPQTNGFADDRNGWGASAVDAFSTALVMQEWDVVAALLEYIPKINFDKAIGDISLFETTIRYLGGLVSAYDLLTGSFKNELNSTISVEKVLSQAKRLADNLSVAFNTTSGVPDNSVRFDPPRRGGETTNGIATIGTLVLEWTRLSDLTGDPKYATMVQKGESYLLHPQPASSEPFPGLIGTWVDNNSGKFIDNSGGWGGGDDSFYEYLIKMYLYDSDRFGEYRDRWILAADSTISNLTSHPSTRPELTFVAGFSGTNLSFEAGHLTCFDGGSFILGGLTLNQPKYVDYGLQLVDGCHDTYVSTVTRIGPEGFQWKDVRGQGSDPPAAQSNFYQKSGFWITSGAYVLRPEVIESYYYAYRATGDPKYQEWAWDAYLAINSTTRVGSGYSSINNVNAPGGGGFMNFQESFWFAEVLKYSYLIHAEEAPWQIKADHTNEYVFNTEAHPIRIFGGREKTR